MTDFERAVAGALDAPCACGRAFAAEARHIGKTEEYIDRNTVPLWNCQVCLPKRVAAAYATTVPAGPRSRVTVLPDGTNEYAVEVGGRYVPDPARFLAALKGEQP